MTDEQNEPAQEQAVAQRVVQLLSSCRSAFEAQGLQGVAELPAFGHELAAVAPRQGEPGGQGGLYELLGYDALILGRPGWAYACLSVAAENYDRAGWAEELRRMRRAGQQLLEAHFPPYADELACLNDVRAWARARRAEGRQAPLESSDMPAPEQVLSETAALKHRWTFRLLHTRSSGVALRLDLLAERFGLSATDQVLLRVAAALHWDHVPEGARPGLLAAGELIELVSEDQRGRASWLGRLESRAPLSRWALVNLLPGPSRALRNSRVELDESVLAWIDGREHWPLELAEQARPHHPAATVAHPFQAQTLERLDRVLRRSARQDAIHVALRCESAAEARALVLRWAGTKGLQVVELLQAGLNPRAQRALFRELRLRDAVVFVPRDARGLAATVGPLTKACPVPVIFDASDEGARALRLRVERLVAIPLRPPPQQERVALWNRALARRGLPEIPGDQLDEALGQQALHPVQIRRIVAQAADQAWLDAGEDGKVQVGVEELRAMLGSWEG